MKRALLLLLLFSGCRAAAPQPQVGCGDSVDDPLARIIAQDAHLEDVTLWQAGFGVGHAQGDATLVVHDQDGNESDFDARLDGTHYGLVADASADDTLGAHYELTIPAGGVSVRALLGHYQGPHVGGDLGVGAHWRNLQNAGGVSLNVTTLSFGVGVVPATWEDLDLELWDDPLLIVPGGGLAGVGTCASDADCAVDEQCITGTCTLVGEGEGEGGRCAEHAAACTPDGLRDGHGNCCDDGDVCVPDDGSFGQTGVCRTQCGSLVVERGEVQSVSKLQEPFLCPNFQTCQVVTPLPALLPMAVACLPEGARDDACRAAFDERFDDAACAAGLDCRPAQVGYDQSGALVTTDLRCKEGCASDDDCNDGERCVPQSAPAPDGSVQHACGVVVPATTSASAPGDPALACNELDGDRYCDQSMFAGADPAQAGFDVCAVTSTAGNDGECFALCAVPAADFDGDGVVDQPAQQYACGTGFQCRFDLGFARGFVEPIVDAGGSQRACACADGPCPAECGDGGFCQSGACVAPWGDCE